MANKSYGKPNSAKSLWVFSNELANGSFLRQSVIKNAASSYVTGYVMTVLLLDLTETTNQGPNVSLKWGHFYFLQEGKAGFIIQVWSEVVKIQYWPYKKRNTFCSPSKRSIIIEMY